MEFTGIIDSRKLFTGTRSWGLWEALRSLQAEHLRALETGILSTRPMKSTALQ
jgi:hypothetical protein